MPYPGDSVSSEIYNVCFTDYCFDCNSASDMTENFGSCYHKHNVEEIFDDEKIKNCLACNKASFVTIYDGDNVGVDYNLCE